MPKPGEYVRGLAQQRRNRADAILLVPIVAFITILIGLFIAQIAGVVIPAWLYLLAILPLL